MKDLDKYKELTDTSAAGSEQDERKTHRRASVAIILIVLFMVIVLTCAVYVVELYFGKTAGTVTLVILAVIIAGYLYRNEIKAKFKRK